MLKLAEGEAVSAVSIFCLTTAYAVADRLMWQGCDLERYRSGRCFWDEMLENSASFLDVSLMASKDLAEINKSQ